MLKRIFVVALTGFAIILNTTTVFFAGSVALAPAKRVAAATEQLSEDRKALLKSKPPVVLKQSSVAESEPHAIPKIRKLVGQSGSSAKLIVR